MSACAEISSKLKSCEISNSGHYNSYCYSNSEVNSTNHYQYQYSSYNNDFNWNTMNAADPTWNCTDEG